MIPIGHLLFSAIWVKEERISAGRILLCTIDLTQWVFLARSSNREDLEKTRISPHRGFGFHFGENE